MDRAGYGEFDTQPSEIPNPRGQRQNIKPKHTESQRSRIDECLLLPGFSMYSLKDVIGFKHRGLWPALHLDPLFWPCHQSRRSAATRLAMLFEVAKSVQNSWPSISSNSAEFWQKVYGEMSTDSAWRQASDPSELRHLANQFWAARNKHLQEQKNRRRRGSRCDEEDVADAEFVKLWEAVEGWNPHRKAKKMQAAIQNNSPEPSNDVDAIGSPDLEYVSPLAAYNELKAERDQLRDEVERLRLGIRAYWLESRELYNAVLQAQGSEGYKEEEMEDCLFILGMRAAH